MNAAIQGRKISDFSLKPVLRHFILYRCNSFNRAFQSHKTSYNLSNKSKKMCDMPRSNLHMKQSCESHVQRFSRNGERGSLVTVTGSKCQFSLPLIR